MCPFIFFFVFVIIAHHTLNYPVRASESDDSCFIRVPTRRTDADIAMSVLRANSTLDEESIISSLTFTDPSGESSNLNLAALASPTTPNLTRVGPGTALTAAEVCRVSPSPIVIGSRTVLASPEQYQRLTECLEHHELKICEDMEPYRKQDSGGNERSGDRHVRGLCRACSKKTFTYCPVCPCSI